MDLTTTEKIKLICSRVGMTMGDLADKTGQTRQNLSNKFGRDNFSEAELKAIAAAMGCTVSITFQLPDGKEI